MEPSLSASAKRTIKVEITGLSTPVALEVLKRLLECGEIHALYPCKGHTTAPDANHYFVEYKHDGSVERATRLKFNGENVRVYSLALNPGLLNDVRLVNQPSGNHLKPLVTHHSTQEQPKGTASPSARTNPTSSPATSSERRPSDTSLSRTLENFSNIISEGDPRNESVSPSDNLQRGLSSTPASGLASPNQISVSPLVRSSRLETLPSHPAPGSPISILPRVGTGPFSSLEKRLEMSLCGERITYDLEELGDDPSVIIHLLKATSSERGNWMTVGGQYRRNGNPAAALAVTTELITVLRKNNVSDDDLRPAFLMLSGCETDLAKKVRASDEKLSAEHYAKSQKWLQKVYGLSEPIRNGHVVTPTGPRSDLDTPGSPGNHEQTTSNSDTSMSTITDTHSNSQCDHGEQRMRSNSAVDVSRPRAKANSANDPSLSRTSVRNHDHSSKTHGENTRHEPRPSPSQTSPTSPRNGHTHCTLLSPVNTPNRPAHHRCPKCSPSVLPVLKREVRCLRDRQSSQARALDDLLTSKRKLEDTCAWEREQRRKLERQLGEMENELRRGRERGAVEKPRRGGRGGDGK